LDFGACAFEQSFTVLSPFLYFIFIKKSVLILIGASNKSGDLGIHLDFNKKPARFCEIRFFLYSKIL
jgi:hypothetical protein